jgi:two-component system chemotaxis response regulator CheY
MPYSTINANLRLLIVNGDAQVRAKFKSALMHLGFSRIMEADSARAAQKLLGSHDFSLVICSLTLPDNNGISFFQKVRQTPPHDQLPFLFVTSSIDDSGKSKKDWPHLPRCEFIKLDADEKDLRQTLSRLFDRELAESEYTPPPAEPEPPPKEFEQPLIEGEAAASRAHLPKITFEGYEKLHVMIVDSNDDFRGSFRLLLKDLGFKHIVEAENSSTGLRRLESGQVDFIITDWQNGPTMSGYDFVRAVRKNDMTAGVPIVVLTSITDKEQVLKALRARVDDYLLKPIDHFLLAEMFNRILPQNQETRVHGNSYKGISLDDEAAIEYARSLVKNAFATVKENQEKLAQVRILLVDQDEHFRRVCGTLLRRMGLNRILETGSGLSALKKLENGLVDIVFCDWFVDPIKGLEILQSIRSISFLRTIPFVMLTDVCSQETVVGALRAGVTDYIAKPCTIETLAETLAQILAQPI